MNSLSFRSTALVWVIALTAACAKLPLDYPRTKSFAFDHPEQTRLAKWIAPQADAHPRLSAYHLLPAALDAYVARLLLVDNAEKTLDLQYFIFEDDLTGKLLAAHLLAAADRGVRVRILVDDWNEIGKDHFFAALGDHPNVETRIFNPIASMRTCGFGRPWDYIFASARTQKRMHNKAIIADNIAAIVGGRNIADEYFAASDDLNFGDMDILVLGAITRGISEYFDEFWNDDLAIPAQAFVNSHHREQDLSDIRAKLVAYTELVKDSPYARGLRQSRLMQQLQAGSLPVVWAQGEVLFDHPEKTTATRPADPTVAMAPRLRQIIDQTHGQAQMISPYLVPGPRGIVFFKQLSGRGVKIQLLTNSLASTDEPAAYGAYVRYRPALLSMGVDLYELRPIAQRRTTRTVGGSRASPSRMALHAKTFVLDRNTVFVGSFNLDLRSARLDTQNGIVVHSGQLATQLARLFERDISPAYSFHVMFEGTADGDSRLPPKDTRIVFLAQQDHTTQRYHDAPQTTCWRRFNAWFLSLIVPETSL